MKETKCSLLFLNPSVSMLHLIRQDVCIHNELHLKARPFVLSAVPSFVLKQGSGNWNVNMTQEWLTCLWGDKQEEGTLIYSCLWNASCLCIHYCVEETSVGLLCFLSLVLMREGSWMLPVTAFGSNGEASWDFDIYNNCDTTKWDVVQRLEYPLVDSCWRSVIQGPWAPLSTVTEPHSLCLNNRRLSQSHIHQMNIDIYATHVLHCKFLVFNNLMTLFEWHTVPTNH